MNILQIDNDTDWFKLALRYQNEDSMPQAILCIDHYCLQFPQNIPGRIMRALIYCELANYDLAEDVLRSIRLTKKSDPKLLSLYHRQWARLHTDRNEREEAIKHLDLGIEVRQSDVDSYLDKAYLSRAMGDNDAARRTLEVAIRESDSQEEAWLELGNMLVSQMRFSEAKEAFETAAALASENDKALKALEDISSALVLLSSEVSIDVPPSESHESGRVDSDEVANDYDLARMQKNRGEFAQALICLQRYTRKKPKSTLAPLLRADILRSLGNTLQLRLC